MVFPDLIRFRSLAERNVANSKSHGDLWVRFKISFKKIMGKGEGGAVGFIRKANIAVVLVTHLTDESLENKLTELFLLRGQKLRDIVPEM